MQRIVIVGLGGIGSWLLASLAKYLANLPQPDQFTILLVDGDSYEGHNAARQVFSELGNKAASQAASTQQQYDNLTVEYKTCFVGNKDENAPNSREAEPASEILKEGDIVLSCVDNHKTRKHLSDACRKLRNVWLVSGGNDLVTGNVQVFYKTGGHERHPPITHLHDEIESPADRSPHEMSCEELAATGSAPQVIFSNLYAATLMGCAVYQILQGLTPQQETYFSVTSSKANPRTPSPWPPRNTTSTNSPTTTSPSPTNTTLASTPSGARPSTSPTSTEPSPNSEATSLAEASMS